MRHLLPNNVHTATEYIWEMPTNNAIELTWKRSRQRPKSRRSVCRTDSRTFSVGWGVLCNSSNNHMHEWTVETLALFPGHSHLQYLMAYSMQIQRGAQCVWSQLTGHPAYRLPTFCTREDWTWGSETGVNMLWLLHLLAHRLHGLSAQTEYGMLHTPI